MSERHTSRTVASLVIASLLLNASLAGTAAAAEGADSLPADAAEASTCTLVLAPWICAAGKKYAAMAVCIVFGC